MQEDQIRPLADYHPPICMNIDKFCQSHTYVDLFERAVQVDIEKSDISANRISTFGRGENRLFALKNIKRI